MSGPRVVALGCLAALCLAALPANAQTYYQPRVPADAPVGAPQRDVYRRPPAVRWYLPFLRQDDYGTDAPNAEWQGAYAISPSGRRVYYVPAPQVETSVMASAEQGDQRYEAPVPRMERGVDPRFRRQEVAYTGPERAGTIVINPAERFLYLVEGNGMAIRYGIGVGREGFLWHGVQTISRKAEWPDWRPPAEMIERRPDLPRFMPGGPQNPLGARAMYLGASLYRIHGTNEPHTIGQAVSSGCIRLMNEDVIDLYSRVKIGTRVVVL